MDKIDELIKNEISIEVRGLFPDIIISVTQAHVSKDLSHAKVWVSAIDRTDLAVKLCQSESKQIRKELAGRVVLRKIPEIHFVPDHTGDEASKIDKLIEETKTTDDKSYR